MVCMLSNKETVADCGRSMPLRSVSVWQSFCLWTSHGPTSPTGMVPFYLDWVCVSLPAHNWFLPLRMERHHTCNRQRAWLCILKTQTSWANMPLCRYGGVLSVQIESKIRPLVQEEAKNSTLGYEIWGHVAFHMWDGWRICPQAFEMQHILMKRKQS